jgi:hypothetical protein
MGMNKLIDQTVVRCVGTYHKTGTVWMRNVFRDAAEILGTVSKSIKKSEKLSDIDSSYIYLQDHCLFPDQLYGLRIRGIRIIRDPRDVVISGAHYHVRSDEPWLSVREDVPGALSYSETINGYEDWEDRYLYEMRMVGGQTIRQMIDAEGDTARADFIKQNFLTIRYEDMIGAHGYLSFAKICSYLKLPYETILPAFEKNSLHNADVRKTSHVTSGKGGQWREKFSRRVAEEFAAHYQYALEALGYERDDSWIDQVRS